MNKIITMFVCSMAAIMLLLLITRWVTYKLKAREEEGEVVQLPLSVWIACILGAGSIIMYRVLVTAGLAVDIWHRLKPMGAAKDMATTCCLLLGTGACWLLLLMGMNAVFAGVVLMADPRKSSKVEVHSMGYFVIRGILLLAGSFLFLPVLEGLLQLCLPAFNLSYYH